MTGHAPWLSDEAFIAAWEAKAKAREAEGESTYDLLSCAQELRTRLEQASEVTADERMGLRFREEVITVKTTWNLVGELEQLVLAPSGVMQKRVLRTMEKQAREALIALGWTPPQR